MTEKWIVADPEHLGGKPRVAGTRISIGFLLESVACGMSIREIVKAYRTPNADRSHGCWAYRLVRTPADVPAAVRIAAGELLALNR